MNLQIEQLDALEAPTDQNDAEAFGWGILAGVVLYFIFLT